MKLMILFVCILMISGVYAFQFENPNLPKLEREKPSYDVYSVLNVSQYVENWSLYPAVSDVDIDGNSLLNVLLVETDEIAPWSGDTITMSGSVDFGDNKLIGIGNSTFSGNNYTFLYNDDIDFYIGNDKWIYFDTGGGAIDFLNNLDMSGGNITSNYLIGDKDLYLLGEDDAFAAGGDVVIKAGGGTGQSYVSLEGGTDPLGSDGYVRIGIGTVTSHSLSAVDDFVVGGKLEVNDPSYFDSTMYVSGNVTTSLIANSGNLTVGGELKGTLTYLCGGGRNSNAIGNEYLKTFNGVDFSANRGCAMPKAGSITMISATGDVSAATAPAAVVFTVKINGVDAFDCQFVATLGTGAQNCSSVQRRGVDVFDDDDVLSIYVTESLGIGGAIDIDYPIVQVWGYFDD